MKKIFISKILLISFLLLLSIYTFIPAFTQVKLNVYAKGYSPQIFPEKQVKKHSDNDFNYYSEILNDWDVNIAFENSNKVSEVIRKRTVFEKGDSKIILDVWDSNGKPLEENFQNLEYIFLDGKGKSSVGKGRINGIDAILSSNLQEDNGNLPHLSVFFQTDKFIYRINHPYREKNNIETYLAFILRFKLQDRKNIEDYSIEKLQLPRKNETLGLGLLKKVKAADTCGGYTLTGNPFPCCSSGGNCTWWAIYKRSDLKNKITWGNAGQDWINQANQANLPVYSDPVQGSIVVWGPNGDRSGHVAYVNSVSNSNLFNISEMNCSGSVAPGPRDVNVQKNYSDYWVLTFLGFIGGESGSNVVIQNQNISSGTFTSTNQITVKPESTLNPSGGDIILRIQ